MQGAGLPSVVLTHRDISSPATNMLSSPPNDNTLISKEMLEEARQRVKDSPLKIVRTPLINVKETTLTLESKCNLLLKLENMQNTGSFKIRGVANQFARAQQGPFITMSAGNYGRAFAYALKWFGHEGRVLMPNTAPPSRASVISSYGVDVEMLAPECLKTAVDRYVRDHNMTFLHPFDDLDLISGYGSLAFEILQEVPEPDVILVCCGGGGLLAGIASAVKHSSSSTKIYGVEPEGACTMFRSLLDGKPVTMDAKSIAAGLAPPFAGTNTLNICMEHVEDVVLVSEKDIVEATSLLYRAGLVVEPSGAAAFAAVLKNKIPDLDNKTVIVVLTGGNVSPEELSCIFV
ncbi:L-threonine ammonia-lyase-like [Ambystoma mexicanum]|uniref:L-threonine ammonia-lyase-like n=1 Tax=Ambystoma mexicanum TaxID=8296 RepID=UPI0037E98C8C